MLNPIAEQLIHNLRHDAHTQKHFSIDAWGGKGTCGTVGCIAGTALAMAGEWKPEVKGGALELSSLLGGWDFLGLADYETQNELMTERGCQILGIQFQDTSRHLFIPFEWRNEIFDELVFDYLPSQARPSSEYVAEMAEWSREFDPNVTPQQAARALELVTKDELPYCDWKRAVEEA